MSWRSWWVRGWMVVVCAAAAQAGPPNVLCTVYPVYQITRNVAEGREGMVVDLMLPSSLGCPHNYALTPQDMARLARADILVINGLGLEEFLGAPVEQANPRLRVIDSSAGIEPLAGGEGGCSHGHAHGDHGACSAHAHGAVNPHIFASPRLSGKMAMTIAAGLSGHDPDGAGLYFRNAAAYQERMNALAGEMAAAVAALPNRRIVQPHGVFDYLARDIGLEIAATTQPHGQEPSAAEMLALLRDIREQRAGAIFTEPQYSPRVGQTLARETGIASAVLDPGASGPPDAPLDHYETVMRRNLETLAEVLGRADR
jgi:zinc transport system substrate-binding protein